MKQELLGLCGWGHSRGLALEGKYIQSAKNECILPFLGWRIQTGELSCLDESTRGLAVSSFRRHVGESIQRNEMVRRLAKALGECEIPAIAYKGLALAQEIYPEMGCRSMSDVDLLIPPAAWEKGRVVLTRHGFNPIDHPRHAMTLRFYHEIHFRGPLGQLVDLHRRPFPWPLFRVGYREIKSVSRLHSTGFWFPDREALFVLVAMHAAKDAFRVPLRTILDAFLLEAGGLNEDRVREYAIDWRARRAVGLWLRILVKYGLDGQWENLSLKFAPESDSLPVSNSGKWAKRRVISSLQDQSWRGVVLALLRGIFRMGDVMMRVKRP